MRSCFVFLALLVLGCKTTNSQLSDGGEGYASDVTSYEQILEELNNVYQLGPQQKEQLRMQLRNVILSTFKINCPDSTEEGTGFFIDKGGKFVSSGRLINDNFENCAINFIQEDRGGFVNVSARHHIKLLGNARELGQDLAFGRLIGVNNRDFIDLENTNNVTPTLSQTNSQVLAVSFSVLSAGSNYLDAMSSWPCREKNYGQNLQAYAAMMRKVNPDTFETSAKLNDYAASEAAICNFVSSRARGDANTDLRVSIKKLGLYISFGRLLAQSRQSLISDINALPGSMGSALIDLRTGRPAGVISGGVDVGANDKGSYPFSRSNVVSKSSLDALQASGLGPLPVCICDWAVFENKSGSSSEVLSTSYLECIPPNIEDENYCTDISTNHIGNADIASVSKSSYAQLRNCVGPVAVNKSSCYFEPGTKYRARNEQDSLQNLMTDEKILSHSSKFEEWLKKN